MAVIFLTGLAVVLAVAFGLALGHALRHDTRGRQLVRELEDWRKAAPVRGSSDDGGMTVG